MGEYSWDCKVCERSLRCLDSNAELAWASEAVIVPSRGDTMEGQYDGFGHVGGVQIPEAWTCINSAFDINIAESMERRAEALFALIGADPPSVDGLPAWAAERMLALDGHLRGEGSQLRKSAIDARERSEKQVRERVAFTVYHRRCWESSGRPGFQGQSAEAKDQGWWGGEGEDEG